MKCSIDFLGSCTDLSMSIEHSTLISWELPKEFAKSLRLSVDLALQTSANMTSVYLPNLKLHIWFALVSKWYSIFSPDWVQFLSVNGNSSFKGLVRHPSFPTFITIQKIECFRWHICSGVVDVDLFYWLRNQDTRYPENLLNRTDKFDGEKFCRKSARIRSDGNICNLGDIHHISPNSAGVCKQTLLSYPSSRRERGWWWGTLVTLFTRRHIFTKAQPNDSFLVDLLSSVQIRWF